MKRLFLLFFCFLFAGAVHAADYRFERDILYRTDASGDYARRMCRLDVACPPDAEDAPVVVWFHGAGLTVDGIVGPRTRQELQDQLAATGEAVFLIALQEKRQAFYRSCKQFPVFGKGWLNRCDDAFSVAQELV